MRTHQTRVCIYLGLIASIATCVGCSTTGATSKQLARIAKDWSLLIRASQIIPVYPLTEDIQPGDVFLVRTPIEEQVKLFESKGFLPLENLITRLPPYNYESFYAGSYGTKDKANVPHHWQFPENAGHGWNDAPRAAFPSYSFSVQRNVGLNLAIPVQGVPVALSLLGAGEAHGDVTIADAYTYGVDMQSLHNLVKKWSEQDTNAEYLVQFAPNGDQFNYLRVVIRVYLTGKVNISVTSDEGYGAAAKNGAAVNLLNNDSQVISDDYEKTIKMMNNTVGEALPGTLNVVAISGRSVSLVETFPRPLVIGYVGFDLPILENGRLGTPVSTQSQLTRPATIEAKAEAQIDEENQMITEIIAYVKDSQGSVDSNKLEILISNTGLTDLWAKKYIGKPVSELKVALNNKYRTNVPALARNLHKSSDKER